MNTALGRNNAVYMAALFAATEYALTAGAGTDNSEQTCATVNRLTAFDAVRHQSAAAIIAATATLAATKTLTITGIWEHSRDNVTWAEIGTDTALLTLTGATGGSTETGAAVLGINLAEADQYVRFKQLSDLSATGTDTAKVQVQYVFTSASEI
jgi:hypothetical protein